ncbi:MAG: hypothetical protein LBR75_02900 [Prevotellaceae bacterium]|jgi:uncharacterized protein (TIGR02145 family)|nr:hypothetical protein [Prevotellaceae bacterium]
MKKFIFLSGFFLAVLGAGAQVTIGSGNVPSEWSLLDIDTSVQKKGLHSPRINNDEREALVKSTTDKTLKEPQQGLLIFNTDTKCLEYWNGREWISLCKGDVPSEPCLDCPQTADITTFVNVMYDFQHQTLEAYNVNNATNLQWQVRTAQTDEAPAGEWKSIEGANATTYKISERFVEDSEFPDNTEYLEFRYLMTNASNERAASPILNIMFIHTEGPGYGEENGVKYLTIQRSTTGVTGDEKNGAIRVALFNLGANAQNDAKNLGDLYQWGRVADGHQTATWSKNAERVNQITHSGKLLWETGLISNEPNGQITENMPGYGVFINVTTGSDDWTFGPQSSRYPVARQRWGNGANGKLRSAAPVNAEQWNATTNPQGWIFPENNPCQQGWRVPSAYEFVDMYRTTANGMIFSAIKNATAWDESNPANNNKWTYRPVQEGTNAFGGIIITNSNNEKLFLPALGARDCKTGEYAGSSGIYWSSTPFDNPQGYYVNALNFQPALMQVGSIAYAYGAPVRPVQDVPAFIQPDPVAVTLTCTTPSHTFNLGVATGCSGTITYQWQSDASGAWVNIPSATSATYTTDVLTENTSFRRIATSTCGTITSEAALVTAPDCVDLGCNPTGVLINGVKWACTNIDAPGTFAANPEDAGMLYQWNRKVGWSATEPLVNSDGGTVWDSSNPAGSNWEAANDPSPTGWRIPTQAELEALFDYDKVEYMFATVNNVHGWKFTDKATGNSIFLPIAGIRDLADGTFNGSEKTYGLYWSSTGILNHYAYGVQFYGGSSEVLGIERNYGMSVRCVAK